MLVGPTGGQHTINAYNENSTPTSSGSGVVEMQGTYQRTVQQYFVDSMQSN